jgi:nucleoside-diphosphate-sugar epimerase
MRRKKILICGATGFIGRNIAEFFAGRKEFEVYGTYFHSPPLENPQIKMLRADLTDKDDVDSAIKGMDVIIQAAATTSGAKDIVTKPYYHVTDNAVMNSLIFRAAYKHKVSHVVFFSCTVMYQSSDKPVKETDFDANKDIFPKYFGVGWTKVYIEKMCEFYSRIGPTKYTVIRHSNIYGPHDKFDLERSHVFGATITKVMSAQDRGKITVWGTGEEERDLLYVSDLVSFVEAATSKQESKFELFNVGYGDSVSVKDLAGKIIASSGKNISIEYDVSKPTIKTKLCLDTSKAKDIIGWSSQISLEEGIQKTIVWYRENILKVAQGAI